MVKVLGLPLKTFLVRLGGAIVVGAITLILFFYLPNLLYSNVPELAKSTGINSSYFLYYAGFITILSGISMIYRDHLLGDITAMGNGLAQIYYIYIITNGGLLSLSLGTINFSIDFSTLLYFLMLPSAILVISSVIRMLSRAAASPFRERDQIVLH
jgi:hypothetical protein